MHLLSALQIGVDAHNTPKQLNTHTHTQAQAQTQANKDRHRHTQLTHISVWNKQEVLVEYKLVYLVVYSKLKYT